MELGIEGIKIQGKIQIILELIKTPPKFFQDATTAKDLPDQQRREDDQTDKEARGDPSWRRVRNQQVRDIYYEIKNDFAKIHAVIRSRE